VGRLHVGTKHHVLSGRGRGEGVPKKSCPTKGAEAVSLGKGEGRIHGEK